MRLDDAAAVNRLSGQLGYPETVAVTTSRMASLLAAEGHCLLVAVSGAEVAGWMQVSEMLLLESGRFAEIVALVVEESRRGQGLGKQLVDVAGLWCSDRGLDRLRVRSNVTRTGAHLFYLRQGFSEIKESKVFEMLL